MPEQEHHEAFAPRSERINKPIEIVHYANADILINNNSRDGLWGPRLADVFRDGLPRDWDVKVGRLGDVVVGEVAGRHFAAKRRRHTTTPGKLRDYQRSGTDGPALEGVQGGMGEIYANNSLVREIRLAPEVTAALADNDFQRQIQELGYTGISYVEPIIGIIDQNAQKFMVYDFIPNAKNLAEAYHDSEIEKADVDSVVDLVSARLEVAGITPNDLVGRNVMVDADRQLYLIDAEGYTARRDR